MDITEFLLARIAEDEAEARIAQAEFAGVGYGCYAPPRVLAECATKRLLIETLCGYEPNTEWDTEPDMGKRLNNAAGAMRHAAALYEGHPDFNPEWKL